MKSIKQISKELDGLLERLCDNSILKMNPTMSSKEPVVFYEIVTGASREVKIRIIVRHGPFLTERKENDVKYFNIESISYNAIMNQILNSLTFPYSPFELKKTKGKTKFFKKLEVLG